MELEQPVQPASGGQLREGGKVGFVVCLWWTFVCGGLLFMTVVAK